jgi:peptidoglycan/LPS O-acetylase OafA/YrhL
MNYRQEIDGLRTIAVMAVVIYHAAFALGDSIWLSGGYIGVDIFFVISGYLITRIIIGQETEGRFSLGQFYLSRIRRIVPALAVMVLLVMPLGWRFMLPDQFETLAQSALGALGYYSNFVFGFEAAYNAAASTLKPLLLTWSLSVEGQFYILFPLLMLLLMRTKYSIYAVGVLTLICGLSLLIAQITAATNQTYNFFLLPSRSWELLAGSLLAISEVIKGRRETPEIVTLWLPTAGMVAIIGSFIFFDDAMPLPGMLTLIPIAGTMAIIWSAQKGELVGDLLSLAPVVYIGKISYSLYLWHFPVFVFMRISGVGFETPVLKIVGIIVSFGLALLSYYLVERPFRDRKIMCSRQFGFAMVSVMALAAFAHISVLTSNGMPKRLGDVGVFLQETSDYKELAQNNDCRNRPIDDTCITEGTAENVILFGDSHANAISPLMQKAAEKNNWRYQQLTLGGCPYLTGYDRAAAPGSFWTASRRNSCLENSAALDKMLQTAEPMTLIYFARLPFYTTGKPFNNPDGVREVLKGKIDIRVDKNVYPKVDNVQDAMTISLRKMQSYGHRLIVIYPYPEIGWQVPTRLHRMLSEYSVRDWKEAYPNTTVTVSYDTIKQRTAQSNFVLNRIFSNEQTARIRPQAWMCSDETGRCVANGPDGIYYYDDDHASGPGAAKIVEAIELAISSMPPLTKSN